MSNLKNTNNSLYTDALRNISYRIIGEVNNDKGIIDTYACINAAKEIEDISINLEKNGLGLDNYTLQFYPNPNKITFKFGFKNNSYSAILLALMKSREVPLSRTRLATITNCGAESISVYICNIRKIMKKFGFENIIHVGYGVGYFISSDDCEKILAFVNDSMAPAQPAA